MASVGGREVQVRAYTDADRERWQAFVARVERATLYHDIRWKRVVESAFGHRAPYLLCVDRSDAVRGILPLVHVRTRLFGSFIVSVPYFNYGGVCADDAGARQALVEAGVRLAQLEGASHLELRHTDPDAAELRTRSEKVSMRLPLPSSPDALWRDVGAKLRSQVKRPEREGMRAEVGGVEHLAAFYEVFAENMRDLGTPVYGLGFFRAIADAFGDAVRVSVVYQGTRPVAAGVLLRHRDTVEIPWASSLRSHNRLGPNMLLYWTALKFACEAGARVFDFGGSSRESGTFRIKQQWGAVPVTLYWHYWVHGGGALPALSPSNPRYGLAIAVWRWLPVWVTTAIGPSIARGLP